MSWALFLSYCVCKANWLGQRFSEARIEFGHSDTFVNFTSTHLTPQRFTKASAWYSSHQTVKNKKNTDKCVCAHACVCAADAVNLPVVFSLLEVTFAAFQIAVRNCLVFYVMQLRFL